MYLNIKKDGNYWIYALILTSNDFAHDLVCFQYPKKCCLDIAYISRQYIEYKMMMMDDAILSRLHCWSTFVSNHDQIEFDYDPEKSKIEFERFYEFS